MRDDGAIETFEVERKYQVDEAALLPGIEVFSAFGLRLDAPQEHELRATYFDTPEGHLAAGRLALRSRTGGKDEGWHLKAKGDDGARELLWPPASEMPEGLRSEIEDRLGAGGAERLRPIASLRTRRTTALLLDASGSAVVELADDRVDATNELSGRRKQWREWEAELMPGADAALLELIEPVLTEAGANRVHGTSKIQRTMQED